MLFSGRAHVGEDPAGDLSGDNQRDAVIVSETNVEYRLFSDSSRYLPRKWLFLLNKIKIIKTNMCFTFADTS